MLKKIYPRKYNFLLTEWQYDGLKRVAEHEECAVSDVMRQMVTDRVNQFDKETEDV